MYKVWRYYRYYFLRLWIRPLVWVMLAGIIYAQFDEVWWHQAIIYGVFALLLPFAVALERTRKDYDLDEIEGDLNARDQRRMQKIAERNRRKNPPDPATEESENFGADGKCASLLSSAVSLGTHDFGTTKFDTESDQG